MNRASQKIANGAVGCLSFGYLWQLKIAAARGLQIPCHADANKTNLCHGAFFPMSVGLAILSPAIFF